MRAMMDMLHRTEAVVTSVKQEKEGEMVPETPLDSSPSGAWTSSSPRAKQVVRSYIPIHECPLYGMLHKGQEHARGDIVCSRLTLVCAGLDCHARRVRFRAAREERRRACVRRRSSDHMLHWSTG